MNIHSASKTKIIATIGPATASEDRLRELIIEGIDVCRLNFCMQSCTTRTSELRVPETEQRIHTHIALM
jgi:pyruvate kinase